MELMNSFFVELMHAIWYVIYPLKDERKNLF